MNPKQLKSVFLFKVPFFLHELILEPFLLNSFILLQKLGVLGLGLRNNTLIDEFVNIFKYKERVHHFCSLFFCHGFDFVDQPFNFYRAVIFDL